MKKTFLFLLTISLGLFLAVGGAAAYTISDNYYGADDHGYGDVIGYPEYDVEKMEVNLSGSTLSVDIYTYFDPSITSSGALFGDLFISTNGWTPYGSSPYLSDNASNGETWEYVFDVSTGNLYDISDAAGQAAITLSYGPTGWTWRNGQEVLVDPTGLTAKTTSGTPTYSVISGDFNKYQMSIDLGSLDWSGIDLGFHWGMTCANDVIEGEYPAVPLPATAILLGSGLICLVRFGRKKLFEK